MPRVLKQELKREAKEKAAQDESLYDKFSMSDQLKFRRKNKLNPYAFRSNGRIISKDYKLKIKTELCKSFMETGSCPFDDKCAFAHGDHEL